MADGPQFHITKMRVKDSPGLAMQTPKVRAALAAKAAQAQARVEALGAAEGVTMNARVESGTRPKGRAYSNVMTTNTSQEFGSRIVRRRRILGRVAEEFNAGTRTESDLIRYVTKAGKVRMATPAQVANWTRGRG